MKNNSIRSVVIITTSKLKPSRYKQIVLFSRTFVIIFKEHYEFLIGATWHVRNVYVADDGLIQVSMK